MLPEPRAAHTRTHTHSALNRNSLRFLRARAPEMRTLCPRCVLGGTYSESCCRKHLFFERKQQLQNNKQTNPNNTETLGSGGTCLLACAFKSEEVTKCHLTIDLVAPPTVVGLRWFPSRTLQWRQSKNSSLGRPRCVYSPL